MQPARAKPATASRTIAQSVAIMMGSFRSEGMRVAEFHSASLHLPNFDKPIMTAATYAAVARILHFCRFRKSG